MLIRRDGLIRAKDLELGRDADTGGQILYVVELARALAELPGVERRPAHPPGGGQPHQRGLRQGTSAREHLTQ